MSCREQRVLFILPYLAKPVVTIQGFRDGTESLSGTDGSCLLVADELAGRGRQVGIWVRAGAKLVTAARQFEDQKSAMNWVQDGRIILCTWQQDMTKGDMPFKSTPWVWTQLPISRAHFSSLRSGSVDGVIAVSDTVRLPFLHSPYHRRVGRVYNPLNPFFHQSDEPRLDRYRTPHVVFSGYIGESKGVHRLLQIWPYVKQKVPSARLTIAGSSKLYDTQRQTGSFGIATPDFESKYVVPLAKKYGGVEAAGIHFAGLQSARRLRELYLGSALGIVNPNWNEYTETFCCAAVEMLASRLPVFSCAAGALPETIGRSGGAVLARTQDIARTGAQLARLLIDKSTLERLGACGRHFVLTQYNIDAIADCWERMLEVPAMQLHRTSGPWCGPRGGRYWAERCAQAVGMGEPYRKAVELGKKIAIR